MLRDNQMPSVSPEIWGGFECTINRVGNSFFDQLDYAGHYQRSDDIAVAASLGIKKIRYPVLWEKHQPHADCTIDWSATEQRLKLLQEQNIDVIAGLVHHGSGPAFTSLADEKFPYLLAQYAKQVAQKFPWINYYTPVNEPLTTARFSGLYGLWYPHKNSDASFIQMLLNQLKAVVLCMKEIRKINPNAQLVQTEDLCKIYSTPQLSYQARFENERRWLSYDILTGRVNAKHPLWNYFIRKGATKKQLSFFKNNTCTPDIFGFNHYLTSERFLDHRLHLYPQHTHGGNGKHIYADVEAVRVPLNENSGLGVLLEEAWQRYKKPIAVTEVHLHCHREDQLRWFNHVWNTCLQLHKKGIPVKGVTAWALAGSFGWNKLLTQPAGDYEAGAFDVRSGKMRPTALAAFIKNIHQATPLHQQLSTQEGWWQRENRFLNPVRQAHLVKINAKANSAPILIIGKRGTLGSALKKVCDARNLHCIAVGREECDITQSNSIKEAIAYYKPWAVINAAGYVRVDEAEDDSELCFAQNSDGPKKLAAICKVNGIRLVTFSSDLVFDGKLQRPYYEDDLVNPLNVYGRSKALAEEAVLAENAATLIVRTSSFFGPWDEYNFAHHVYRNLSQYNTFTAANDVLISPTYVPDLVNTVLDLTIDNEKGIWHLTNEGTLSWADFAFAIAEQFGLDTTKIIALSSKEMGWKATRPAYSALNSRHGCLLPPLTSAIQRFANECNFVGQALMQSA